MERTKRNKNLQLLLTESEMNMVDSLRAHLGDISRSEIIRDCIRDKYKKEFPSYMARNLQTSSEGIIGIIPNSVPLTDEQFCESKGGKLVKDNYGVVMCGIGLHVKVPLSDRKTIEFRAKQAGLI